MAKNNITSVIMVDSNANKVLLYTLDGDRLRIADGIKCDIKAYNKGFFDSLGQIIKSFRDRFADFDFQETGMILPDEMFFYDTVSVPLISRRAHSRSLELAIGSIYKNYDELEIHPYPLSQNKQYATYGLVGIRRDILSSLQKACSDNGIELKGVLSISGCLVNGLLAESPRLKNETFLLLDIKEDFSAFVFVFKGQAVGYYYLPFGCSKSDCNILANEQLQFERSYRENEESYNEIRGLAKWALELIANNKALVADGSVNKVYVNMPEGYKHLLERVNVECTENGVVFYDVEDRLSDKGASKDLVITGGLYIGQYNKTNTF